MKRFIAYFLAVVGATYALMLANEAVNRQLAFSASNINAYKMHRLIGEQPDGELPIIGSSRAEAGFAPKEISENVFNYGLSGSSMRETMFHLKCLLSRKGTGVILINLDPWGLGNEAFRGDYRYVASSPHVRAEKKIRLSLFDRIPGFRSHGKFRTNVAEWMNNRLAVTKTMENGAILQRLSRTKAEWEYMISKSKPQKFQYNAETDRMLSELLAANSAYEIFFVVSPVSPPWWEKFAGKKELDDLKRRLASFPHVHVLDYTGAEYGFDLPKFMDLTHLNEAGARRFSRLLKDRLTPWLSVR